MAEKLVKWGTIVLFAAIGLWMFNATILNMIPYLSWGLGAFFLIVAGYLAYKA